MYLLNGHSSDVYALDCDQSKNVLVSGSDDGKIIVWSLNEKDG